MSFGLALDMSLGSRQASDTYGPELVTNGTFESGTTGWTNVRCTLSNPSQQLLVSSTNTSARGYASVTTEIGKSYFFSVDVIATDIEWRIMIGDNASATTNNKLTDLGTDVGVAVTHTFVATATTTYVRLGLNSTASGAETTTFDNVSLREVL